MTTQKISDGLIELGFNSGWVVSGEEIVLWEHSQPQPSMTEILAAAEIFEEKQLAAQAQAESKRQELLDRLGITAEEAKLLLS